MMRKFAFVIIALSAVLFGARANALAPGVAQMFSQSFQMVVSCNSNDEVYSWSVNGNGGAGGNGSPVVLGAPNATYPNGSPPAGRQPGSSFIWPWLPDDITIRGVELVVIPPAPSYTGSVYDGVPEDTYYNRTVAWMPAFSFLMVGNNADGDAMLYLGPEDHYHARAFFPAGTGFVLPGGVHMTNTGYIDLHGSCSPAADPANVMLTFYYTDP
jgi:hypothetical protein